MRGKIATAYVSAIKNYCVESGLSYEKVCSSPYCYDDEELIILHDNGTAETRALGLIKDDEPMPSTLEIYLENGKLRFEQTDITRKYLGADKKPVAAQRPAEKPVRPSIPKRRELAFA